MKKNLCSGCIHWRTLSGGKMKSCHCLIDTGHSAQAFRNGKRKEEVCAFKRTEMPRLPRKEEKKLPRKEEKKVKERHKPGPAAKEYVVRTPEGREVARGTAEEVAKKMGVTVSTVRQWRSKMLRGKTASYRVEG